MSALLLPTSDKLLPVLAVSLSTILVFGLVRSYLNRSKTTELAGPKRPNWLWGYTRHLIEGHSGDYFEEWQKKYGDIYKIPSAGGGERIVLMDARAISYVLTTQPLNFIRHTGDRESVKRLVGDGILSQEGQHHRRHRKTMSPGFTLASIRYFTSIFLDATNKVKDLWLAKIAAQGADKAVILNVEHWMNAISFESIGEAGFAYDFDCLKGELPPIARYFTALGDTSKNLASMIVLALVQAFPIIASLPLPRNKMFDGLRSEAGGVATEVLKNKKALEEMSEDRRALVASIIKAENRNLSVEEVVATINTLVLAGFETTSSTMSWCLHELSLHPEVQNKLREELRKYPEPTHEELAKMPYLNAVTQEALRTHPVVPENHRRTVNDASIPLQHPITLPSGKVVDHIEVPAGSGLIIPIEAMNRSSVIWGPDSHEFKPERWLEGELPKRAAEIQGFHHLLTFIDGPKNCIGRNFAVAEFKAVMSVLIRNFSFAPLTDGSDIERIRTVVQRGRNKGKDGLYLRVSKVDAQ